MITEVGVRLLERSSHEWGFEEVLCRVNLGVTVQRNTIGYTGKELVVFNNGNASSIHFHALKTETFFVEKGLLCLEIYKLIVFPATKEDIPKLKLELVDTLLLKPRDTFTLIPLTPHRFYAPKSVAVFKEFSSWDSPEDSYKIVPAGPLVKEGGQCRNLAR